MPDSSPFKSYYPGQKVFCPGRQKPDRRRLDRGDRRGACSRILVVVGAGEVWHIRWLADKEDPQPTADVSRSRCWDCGTTYEVRVDRYDTQAKAS